MLRHHIKRVWPAYAILLISLTTTIAVYLGMQSQIDWRQSYRFRQSVVSLMDGINLRLTAYGNLIRSYGALFESSSMVNPEEFKQFGQSSGLREDHSGIYDTGFIERVRPFERNTFVTKKLEEGYPNMESRFTEPDMDFFLVMILDDFKTEDVRSVGYNIYRHEDRRLAMDAARDNDAPRATLTTQLFTKSGIMKGPMKGPPGFVIYTPVYKDANNPKTIDERRESLKGFVFGSFDLNLLWQNVYASSGTREISMEVYDSRIPNRESLCFNSVENHDVNNPLSKNQPLFSETICRTLLGREWTFCFNSLPAMDDPPERKTARWLLLGGWGISIFMFGLAWALVQGRWNAEHLSDELHISNRALDDEKKRLTVTLGSIADGVIATDPDGCITMMNPTAEKLTGWSFCEARGLPLTTIYHISQSSGISQFPMQKVLSEGTPTASSESVRLVNKNGDIRLISDTAAPIYGHSDTDNSIIGLVLVFRDVTEHQKLLEEQVKTSKLESLGLMAGGIAHDFNNLLTGILGNISLVLQNPRQDLETREVLATAEKSCLRARDLTSRLLVFSRGGSPVKEVIALSELIIDSARYATHGTSIECEFFIAPDLWRAKVDKSQISQLIHHIVFNAVQASPKNGTITITASNVILESNHRSRLEPGKYAQIGIQDKGQGISEEHRTRIFDPYFTTKAKASGLGLTVAHAIITRHQGAILVDSKAGAGTLVTFFIPADSTASVLPAPAPALGIGTAATGKGRILIMDDEQLILTTAKAILSRLGYEVTIAKDGEAAIQAYQKAHGENHPFAAVILDLTVPEGMGGADAIKELLRIDPSVKAIVSSGYSDDPIMSDYLVYGFKAVVAKPYSVNRIATVLQQLLTGKPDDIHNSNSPPSA